MCLTSLSTVFHISWTQYLLLEHRIDKYVYEPRWTIPEDALRNGIKVFFLMVMFPSQKNSQVFDSAY